jgi:hypothetical protein
MYFTPTCLHLKLKGDKCKYDDVTKLREMGSTVIEADCQITHEFRIANIGEVQRELKSAAMLSDTLIVSGHKEFIGLIVHAIPGFRAHVLLGCNTRSYGAVLASKYPSSWVLSVDAMLRDAFAATIVKIQSEMAPDNKRWPIFNFERLCHVFEAGLGWSITTSVIVPGSQIVHCAKGVDRYKVKGISRDDHYTVLLHAPALIVDRHTTSAPILSSLSLVDQHVTSAPVVTSVGPYRCLNNRLGETTRPVQISADSAVVQPKCEAASNALTFLDQVQEQAQPEVREKFMVALRCFEADHIEAETFHMEAISLLRYELELLGNFNDFLLERLRPKCQRLHTHCLQLKQALMAPEFQRPPLAPRKRMLEPGFDVGDVVELCRKIDQGRQRARGVVQVAKLNCKTVVTKLTFKGGTRYKIGKEYRFEKSDLRVLQKMRKRAKHLQ